MTGAAMAALLRRLAERFDLVLLDGGPVLVAAETLALSRMADEVVYVVRWGKASHRMVLAGLGQLRTVQARVAGIVVSRIVVSRLRSHGFHAFRPARRSVRWPEGSLPSGASALLARVTTLWRGRSQNHSVILPLSRSSAASGGKNG